MISNQGRKLMHDWLPNKTAEKYAMTTDWDDRWRTGGTVEEIKLEAN